MVIARTNKLPIFSQPGFTLIELVVVIVILGIMTAIALPKFTNISDDALQAVVEGAQASVKSAATLAHSETLVEQNSANTSITMEGTTITMVNFYPDAESIDDAASITAADYTVTATSATVTTISKTSAGLTCSFTYTEAGAGAAPAISAVTCS